ncbi:MAG TPA: MazG nucleotide pyrophosphohydrolase domain-containing protein [Phycisphaerales bacterium]|nr:MazG nucleotide pyrophosphohydrolase domain-containing protein [Phycisphaerales bacterium]
MPTSPLPSSGPLTIAAFQRLIRDRYYVTDSARGAAGTFLLFMEEVGELATALHDNRPPVSPTNPAGKKRLISPEERANLEEEFADVLAWLMTLANITGVDFEKALAKYTVAGRVEGTKE